MKTLRFNFVVIVVLMILLSCSKKESINHLGNNQLNAEIFATAGKAHNAALDSILFYLTNKFKKESTIKTRILSNVEYRQEIFAAAKSAAEQVVVNSNYSSSLQDSVLNETDQVFNNGLPPTDDNNLYTSDLASNLTSSQIQILNQLNTIITDNDLNVHSCMNRITALENQVPSLNLTESQQSLIYTATNTAKSSLTYWYLNA